MFEKITEIIKTKLAKKQIQVECNKKDKEKENESQARELGILQKSIDRLSNILQNMNMHDLIYILGSEKEIIRRNLIAGIARGIGSRNRIYYYNSNYNIFFAKNSKT